jgi:hypothetical protein
MSDKAKQAQEEQIKNLKEIKGKTSDEKVKQAIDAKIKGFKNPICK